MEMVYCKSSGFSYQDSVKVLEADIQHANALAAGIRSGKGGVRLQMKLVYNEMAPIFLFFLYWLDCSPCTFLLPRYLNLFRVLVYKVRTDGKPCISTCGRRASIHDFYAVILPSLQCLHRDVNVKRKTKEEEMVVCKVGEVEEEREDECGICLEPCSKVVLPSCCHSMCISCYRDWNMRSESCPFCRGTLKRVRSRDLWVLTCINDVVDAETTWKEELLRFYVYINGLPKDLPDALFLVYYEYLI